MRTACNAVVQQLHTSAPVYSEVVYYMGPAEGRHMAGTSRDKLARNLLRGIDEVRTVARCCYRVCRNAANKGLGRILNSEDSTDSRTPLLRSRNMIIRGTRLVARKVPDTCSLRP